MPSLNTIVVTVNTYTFRLFYPLVNSFFHFVSHSLFKRGITCGVGRKLPNSKNYQHRRLNESRQATARLLLLEDCLVNR